MSQWMAVATLMTLASMGCSGQPQPPPPATGQSAAPAEPDRGNPDRGNPDRGNPDRGNPDR